MVYHQSVLLHESIEALNIYPDGIYIDGTFGLGGHSKLILSKLNKHGRLIAIDRDWLSVKIGKSMFKQDERFTIIHTSFSEMFMHLQNMKLVGLINGILLDLGMCESQLIDSNRGFSFMRDGVLDMRMDVSTGKSASEWINSASVKNIRWVLKTFGEEKFSNKIAKSIVSYRKHQPILRSLQLSKIIANAIPYRNRCNQRKHPATRSFLAIRMYINKELQEIAKVLQYILTLLSPRGRLVIISFNSLEDRLIKRFMYQNSCRIPIVSTKLPLTENQIYNLFPNVCYLTNVGKLRPSIQEVKRNIRARSAILRYSEKLVSDV